MVIAPRIATTPIVVRSTLSMVRQLPAMPFVLISTLQLVAMEMVAARRGAIASTITIAAPFASII